MYKLLSKSFENSSFLFFLFKIKLTDQCIALLNIAFNWNKIFSKHEK